MTACAENGAGWPLVLIGDVGSGKTCAALCLLDRCGNRRYRTVAEVCEELIEIQAGRREHGQQQDTVVRWWTRWREAGLTVLDELGSRDRVSDFQYETVKRAIDERRDGPAIFISNLSLDRLEKVYDDRVASRLAAGTVIQFAGADRRIT